MSEWIFDSEKKEWCTKEEKHKIDKKLQTILKQSLVKKIFKGECWIKKEAWRKLDKIMIEMLADMATRTNKIHKRENRKKATASDIQKVYEEHKASYEADLTEKIADEVIKTMKDLKTLKRTIHEPH